MRTGRHASIDTGVHRALLGLRLRGGMHLAGNPNGPPRGVPMCLVMLVQLVTGEPRTGGKAAEAKHH
jgi:hypothetical protein